MVARIEEKRRFPRIKIEVPLRYQIRGIPEMHHTIANNLSVGGLGFFSEQFIASSAILMLEVNILSRMLNLIGRVAWASPLSHSNNYCMGIEFLELGTREKEYIQDYIGVQQAKL
ncbi:MAG: PilZ domain-containing protein [Candidatus Omnitrophica bacterium]|nr:PilZ domain-containing protein [Candidatus Omnitrophota bacterium]